MSAVAAGRCSGLGGGGSGEESGSRRAAKTGLRDQQSYKVSKLTETGIANKMAIDLLLPLQNVAVRGAGHCEGDDSTEELAAHPGEVIWTPEEEEKGWWLHCVLTFIVNKIPYFLSINIRSYVSKICTRRR